MKRILSVIVALTLVLGATSLFAAQADWNGYFNVKYRSVSSEVGSADKTYETYIAQKLELYPTWKLSENVALHAGFFHQQYWGSGRLYGHGSSDFIASDTGAYKGDPVSGLIVTQDSTIADGDPLDLMANTPNDPMSVEMGVPNTTLGVSSAWATLKFQVGPGELGIDAGRRKNPVWGTGAFFGGGFFPDRLFITYKTQGLGGMMIPVLIYEKRLDTSATTAQDNAEQFLLALIYLKPGKTLAGFTTNFIPSGKYAGSNNVNTSGTFGMIQDGFLFAADLYIDHKFSTGFGSVKPIFEIVYGTGKIKSADQGLTSAWTDDEVYFDVLNFILKAEISIKDLLTATPEVAWQKAADAKNNAWAYNAWGVNQYCGSEYTVGKIFSGFNGGKANGTNATGNALEESSGASVYGKLLVELDIVKGMTKGVVSPWIAGIYGMALDKEVKNGVDVVDSDKTTIMEIDLGVDFKVDTFTTFGMYFAYAKTGAYKTEAAIPGYGYFGKNLLEMSGFSADTTYMQIGADLTIKF